MRELRVLSSIAFAGFLLALMAARMGESPLAFLAGTLAGSSIMWFYHYMGHK